MNLRSFEIHGEMYRSLSIQPFFSLSPCEENKGNHKIKLNSERNIERPEPLDREKLYGNLCVRQNEHSTACQIAPAALTGNTHVLLRSQRLRITNFGVHK